MVRSMTQCAGFKAVSRSDARILILGTLPSVESLKQQQYYAKKQNVFWLIMGELFGAFPELPYQERLLRLMENHIALWDVCAAAERAGSLDAAIKSPVANDFSSFFAAHEQLGMICFNGQQAEKLFRCLVRPTLPEAVLALPWQVLPSTSPAYAGMRFEDKRLHWRLVLDNQLAFVSCWTRQLL